MLTSLSIIYSLAVRLRRLLYSAGILRRHTLGCRVVSVGNITAGGTGKTPAVIMLAQELTQTSRKVCILIRGYARPWQARKHADLDPAFLEYGDEAAMLMKRLPGVKVLAGKNRLMNARRAFEESAPDVILLDDGFQHLKINRDADIVTIDCMNPWGGGFLLPRGRLREPLSALKRAGCFILTHCDAPGTSPDDIKRELADLNPEAVIAESIHAMAGITDFATGAECETGELRGRRVCTVCGIGNPAGFKATVLKTGARVILEYSFRDHHIYTAEEIARIARVCSAEGVVTIVTTEKDAVRMPHLPAPKGISILVLRVDLRLTAGRQDLLIALGVSRA